MHAACSPSIFEKFMLMDMDIKVNGYKTEPQYFHLGKILLRGHSYINFHGKVRHMTSWVYPTSPPSEREKKKKMKPFLVQSYCLTMSWLPLPSVGTAYSIQILRSNAMLKTYGLAHVSSNINEFIRVVLIFFFLAKRFHRHKKYQKH